MSIYLDYNATHPPSKQHIQESLNEYFIFFGNSSGRCAYSQKSLQLVDQARSTIASLFNTRKEQLIFTSSATEANFIALHIIIANLQKTKKKITVWISPFEHPSIAETLSKFNDLEVHTLSFSHKTKSLILLADVAPDLIICCDSSNETGLKLKILEMMTNVNFPIDNAIYLLIDAVQSLRKINQANLKSEFSFLNSQHKSFKIFSTFSAHKIGAGFGTGMLVLPQEFSLGHMKEVKQLTPFYNSVQEFGIRPGSHNHFSIISFAKVLSSQFKDTEKLKQLKKISESFENNLQKYLNEPVDIVAKKYPRYDGTTMIMFTREIQIDFLLMALDQEEIFLSTGTSCKSKSRSASTGLLAMNFSDQQALSVLRISYGVEFLHETQLKFINTLNSILLRIQ